MGVAAKDGVTGVNRLRHGFLPCDKRSASGFLHLLQAVLHWIIFPLRLAGDSCRSRQRCLTWPASAFGSSAILGEAAGDWPLAYIQGKAL